MKFTVASKYLGTKTERKEGQEEIKTHIFQAIKIVGQEKSKWQAFGTAEICMRRKELIFMRFSPSGEADINNDVYNPKTRRLYLEAMRLAMQHAKRKDVEL